jgi:serine/threonine protein kinase
MAEVYLALDQGPAGVERLVVLKRLLPELSSKKYVEMFLNEARIASRLNHPNIAHIYEVGEEQGEYFLAMEFIHGTDLDNLIRRHDKLRLKPAHAALIASRVASALHHAHNLRDLRDKALNIVHRDISPQNIRLSFEGVTKVLDFGIAKASGNPRITQRGILKGKYPYMAPEQILGKPLDGRADLFALGVVLYEMLTYRRLFKRETDAKTLEAVLFATSPLPSELAPGISPRLDQIVLRLLERDPARRYQWAREVESDLEAYLRTTPASTADLEGLVREIVGDERDMHVLLEQAMTGTQIEVTGMVDETPSDSLPTVFDWMRTESGLAESEFLKKDPVILDMISEGSLVSLEELGDVPPAGADAAVIVDAPEEPPSAAREPAHKVTPKLKQDKGVPLELDSAAFPAMGDDDLELESGVFSPQHGTLAPKESGVYAEVRSPATTAQLPDADRLRTTQTRRRSREGGGRSAVVWALIALVVVGAGAGWWVYRQSQASKPVGEQIREVTIQFRTIPDGAEIFIDGVRLTGRTVKLQQSDNEYAIKVTASGYKTRTLVVRPQEDQNLTIALQPVPTL